LSLPLVDRSPTAREVERLRLILSTYQDGIGQERKGALPGWRDFERAVALAFRGEAKESKAIFDVLLWREDTPDVKYGISCKMRGELDRVSRDGRVTIELSNSAKKFWAYLNARGINQTNYKEHPLEVGSSLIEVVKGWHQAVSLACGGNVELERSCYFVLSWNERLWYQLHQFPITLPSPNTLRWHYPIIKRGKGAGEVGRRLAGDDESGTLFEWYGESGGQLKYYPLANTATWASDLFQLEPLGDKEYGILNKAAAYFPQLWADACMDEAEQ
jgi:hypothetical protein